MTAIATVLHTGRGRCWDRADTAGCTLQVFCRIDFATTVEPPWCDQFVRITSLPTVITSRISNDKLLLQRQRYRPCFRSMITTKVPPGTPSSLSWSDELHRADTQCVLFQRWANEPLAGSHAARGWMFAAGTSGVARLSPRHPSADDDSVSRLLRSRMGQ